MARENENLVKSHLILSEGRDAQEFLIYLLQSLTSENLLFDDFQVLNFGGNAQLNQYLKILPNRPGYEHVKSIAVIRDAEKDADCAIAAIKSAFSSNKFAVPAKPFNPAKTSVPATGFVIFPNCCENPENGTLEDLCLKILSKEDAQLILNTTDSTLENYKKQLKQLNKNRLHTYFSLTNEYVTLKIGEAANAKAFKFSGPEIDSLKSFLLQMHGDG
jgi:hypothetical protein